MTIPAAFLFSQSSLDDFQTCPWRFYLRHIERLAWPAPVSEPAAEHERHLLLGARFHHLVQQHLSGIPAGRLSASVDDPDLAAWWERYLEVQPADIPGRALPEHTLLAPLEGHRLLAKYDALVVGEDGRLTIFDWKTTLRRPSPTQMAHSLQTRVYRYVAVRAGAHLTEGNITPEQVRMVYWFPAFPADPYVLDYTTASFQADEAHLRALIRRILACERPEDFPRTEDVRACRFCGYRSLCERGITAGRLEDAFEEGDAADAFDLDMDLDQIAEIEF